MIRFIFALPETAFGKDRLAKMSLIPKSILGLLMIQLLKIMKQKWKAYCYCENRNQFKKKLFEGKFFSILPFTHVTNLRIIYPHT
jgi:hypothetical protein